MNRVDEDHLEEIAGILESVPAWIIKDDPVESLQDIIFAAARKSYLHKRYLDVIKQEGRFWGEVAGEFLSRGEVPRWVDFRRFITQYTKFGKESWVELYNLLFNRNLRHLFLTVNELDGPVLELGCGCGWLSLELARLGKDVTGIDVSENSIALARFFYENRFVDDGDVSPLNCGLPMKPPDEQGAVRYMVHDLNSVMIPESSYSAVVAWETLHHIHNLEGLVDQVRRGLKKDGVFIVHDTINEQVHGRSLHKLLTSPRVLKWISRHFSEYEAPVPETTQAALIDLFRNTFKPAEAEQQELCSPFEGVSGEEMVQIFKNSFHVVRKSGHHHFLTEARGFNTIEQWTEHLGFAPRTRFVSKLFGMIKTIDDLLIKLAHVTPKHAYLVMRPSSSTSLRVPLSLHAKAELHLGEKLSPEEWSARLLEKCQNLQKEAGADLSQGGRLDVFSFQETFHGRLDPAQELSSLMLTSGWHLEEEDQRWTNGNGETYFCFPEGSKRLQVEVLGAPGVSEKNPQEVVIAADGKPIGEFRIISGGWNRYVMDLADIPNGLIKLSIKSRTFVPKEMGISDDGRVLGVAVKYIEAVT